MARPRGLDPATKAEGPEEPPPDAGPAADAVQQQQQQQQQKQQQQQQQQEQQVQVWEERADDCDDPAFWVGDDGAGRHSVSFGSCGVGGRRV